MKQIILASEFYNCQEPIIDAIGGVTGKHVLMIPTAAFGQGKELYPQEDTEPFTDRGASLTVFDIAGKSKEDVVKEVKKADVIYLRGGSPFYLLKQAKLCEFSDVLSTHFSEGVYIGTSSGAIILTHDISYWVQYSKNAPDLNADLQGLGKIDFNFVPHAKTKNVVSAYEKNCKKGAHKQTFVLSDNQALLVQNNHIRLLQESK